MRVRIIQHETSKSSSHTLAELVWGFEAVGLVELRGWLTSAAGRVRGELLDVPIRACSTRQYYASAADFVGCYQFFPKVGVDFTTPQRQLAQAESGDPTLLCISEGTAESFPDLSRLFS